MVARDLQIKAANAAHPIRHISKLARLCRLGDAPRGVSTVAGNTGHGSAVLAGEALTCSDSPQQVVLVTGTGRVAATDSLNQPSGGGCGVFSPLPAIVLNITSDQGAACMELLRPLCPPAG